MRIKKMFTVLLAFMLIVSVAVSVSAADAEELTPERIEALNQEALEKAGGKIFPYSVSPEKSSGITAEDLLQGHTVVSVKKLSGMSFPGKTPLEVISYALTSAGNSDYSDNTRYATCPGGTGKCHTNDFLYMDAIEDDNGKIIYYVAHYGCGMCGNRHHGTVIYP